MNIPEYIKLEMRMADLMAQQEASGFRFDMVAAENVAGRAECGIRRAEHQDQEVVSVLPRQAVHTKAQ